MSDTNPTCSSCRWWAPFCEGFGHCKRRAPVVAVNQYGAASTKFPDTGGDDFCGEHAPRSESPEESPDASV